MINKNEYTVCIKQQSKCFTSFIFFFTTSPKLDCNPITIQNRFANRCLPSMRIDCSSALKTLLAAPTTATAHKKLASIIIKCNLVVAFFPLNRWHCLLRLWLSRDHVRDFFFLMIFNFQSIYFASFFFLASSLYFYQHLFYDRTDLFVFFYFKYVTKILIQSNLNGSSWVD